MAERRTTRSRSTPWREFTSRKGLKLRVKFTTRTTTIITEKAAQAEAQ